MILKDTFALYLNTDQLEQIKKISLVKKLDPSDKFIEDAISIENTNFFQLITAPNTSIPSYNNLYRIISQDNGQIYIIEIVQNDISNQKLLTNIKKDVINFLTSINSVKCVSTYIPPQIKNNINAGFTQKNYPPNQIIEDISTGIYYLPRYINEHGITGKDQIITIQDTPIDPYHAMFRDDNFGEIKINQYLNGHRKFVYYGSEKTSLSNVVFGMEENEHGTHIAGIASGKSICKNDNTKKTSYFNGNAPDSKILYAGEVNEVTPSKLVSLMNNYNSKISSNSWGVFGFNDIMNYQYGKIAYENPDKIFIFAGGNEFKNGYFSIDDPGGSKNVLTVGAIDDFYNYKVYQVETMKSPPISFKAYGLADGDPWIEGTIGSLNEKIIAINAGKGNQCFRIDNSHITLLYGTSVEDFEWILSCQSDNFYGILYTYSASSVERMLQIGGMVKITDITKINISKKIEHASYSSAGPANKGIIKPDVMAPGTHIISAKSRSKSSNNHGCRDDNEGDFTYKSGSSIATPNVAGAIALIRDYFQSKKWNEENVSLNSMTMRALIINSCTHPNFLKKPDVLFGHGVVDVSTVLPFDDSFGVQISNQENPPKIGNNDHLVAQIDVKSNKTKLQITLSYLDPILDEDSVIPIAHDLDLVLISSSGRRFLGDCLKNNDTQHFSTNEKVIINTDEIEIGTYFVHVVAGPFINIETNNLQQSFAVVATGDIENKTMFFGIPTTDKIIGSGQVYINKCPCDICNGDNYSQCQCDNDHIGNLCQAQIFHTTKNDKAVSLLIYPNEMSRLMVSKKKKVEIITIKLINSNGGNSSLWIDDKCHVSVSEYRTFINTKEISKKYIYLDKPKKEFCIAIFNNNYETTNFEINFEFKSNKGMVIGIVFGVITFIGLSIVTIFLTLGCCTNKRVANYSNKGYGQKEVSNKKEDYSNLKLELDLKNKEISKLKKQNVDLNADINKKREKIENLTRENSELKNIHNKPKTDTILSDEINELNAKINEKERENSTLLKQNRELSKNNSSQAETINALQSKIQSLKKDIKNKKQYEDEKIVYNQQIKFLEKHLDRYEQIIQFDINNPKTHMKIDNTKYDKKHKNIESLNLDLYITDEDEENQRIVEKIGEGATSVSYKVIDEKTSQVMCKKIVKEVNSQNAFKKMQNSIKEIQTLLSIDHPCICKAIGFNLHEKIKDSGDISSEDGESKTTVALFLEYLPYKLSDFAKNQMMSSTLKMKIAVEIAFGMQHLHSIGMIHRDLKIENVMLNYIFEAKIIDFDLVRVENEEQKETLTKGIGTLEYMSPEMLNNENYTNKTDIYSYGIFLFALFTGELPKQKLTDKMNGKPISIPKSLTFLTEDFINLINMCTFLDPKKRPSFEEIIEYMYSKAFNFAQEIDIEIVKNRFQALNSFQAEFVKGKKI